MKKRHKISNSNWKAIPKTRHTTPETILKTLLLIVVITFQFQSCDSFVDVELPQSQLISTTVFEDYATANAAMTDIYATIPNKGIYTGALGLGISNQLGNYADEITSTQNPNNPSLNFYNNSLLPSNTTVTGFWNITYNQIYAVNAVIEGVATSQNLTMEQKEQLTGEALFIRALLHFHLVNIFGDVPYITQTDYKKNSTVSRTPIGEIYQNCIVDLQNAIAVLPDPAPTSDMERVRPNKAVAQALLARVYLYNKSYPQAANMASAVLNREALYALEQNMTKVFLIGSKETIWQLQSGSAGLNTTEGAFFTFISGPPPLISLSENLVNSFTGNDLRKSNWIRAIYNGTTTWYHAYKYKESKSTSVSKEYTIVFRLAEQYLIRAEARAEQGDFIGAREDLNKIRHRAGLSDTTASSQQEILNAILEERRWELFTERGQRFFDLKRSGKLDSTLTGLKPGWNTTDSLFPIPQTELNTNPNLLPQNPGY
ncbi:RagB/SusD family nutrient uptake outer membrane protein [Flavobacterium sp. LS1R47]|uniref:RagB/SusD family nutrient uptake outer membrane protein n=1 Tax=Flavobacterium frigoritolerans TaxID=2987686 RepID=A0A9X2ZRR8_9FLAO|nr:RagB/SusD family nutrient uptake outer membrane protein [Flavobacterium frigoritolerans]MCV9932873.1 RagB/SusD family nutrient uptake outer membrane protein [Flavobacterium frigoritolerans]